MRLNKEQRSGSRPFTPEVLSPTGRKAQTMQTRHVRFSPVLWLLILSAGLGLFSPAFAASDNQRARQIVDQVDRLLRGDSSRGTITMQIVTENWQRSLTMRVWSQGTENVLVRIEKPRKEAGMATLKVANNIWNYLPKVNRTIKLPSSMMMASWMGSHFTNDDLVKESRLVRDYFLDITFEGDRDGTAVYEFSLTPRPEAPVVWGKIELEVRQDDLMPTWQRYYDEDGALMRELRFSAYTTMDGRLVPARMVMQPQDKPNEQTRIIYNDLAFDIPLAADTFSLRNLER